MKPVRPKRHFLPAIIAGALFAGSLLVCPDSKAESAEVKKQTSEELKGVVRVSGAWALYPMMVRWGEEFMKKYPRVRIDVSAGGAGKGMTDALSGLVDIGMVSREIRQEEIAQGAFFIPVVKDAVFPTVSSKNPVLESGLLQKGMRREQFIELWIRGKSIRWGEIAGSSSTDKVAVYTRSDSCGAAETWAKYLGGTQEDLLGVAVYGDPGLADAVKRDRNGIGFNNLNYTYDMKTGLPVEGIVVVPIDVNENGKIDPGEDLSSKQKAIGAIAAGIYPSPPVRDLYLVAKEAFKGVSKEFVLWILSDGQRFIDETGYIGLGEEKISRSLKAVKE